MTAGFMVPHEANVARRQHKTGGHRLIVDWEHHSLDVFRRKDARLVLISTLTESDTLTTPLLTGFSCPIAELFAGIPLSKPQK